MDNSALQMLEFPRVRERLAGYTTFSVGRELALSLNPVADAGLVALWLKQSAETRKLLSLRPDFHIGDAFDVREDVRKAQKGAMLDPLILLNIQRTLAASRLVRTGMAKLSEEVPSLWMIGHDLCVHTGLEGEISRCIADTGEIQDAASPRLSDIRWQLRERRRQLRERLSGFIKSQRGQSMLQENLVTERNGRYVLPVRAEHKREVKGIIHDISNTGATVFIEPLETIEAGNELRQAEIEERQEIERILTVLSASAGALAEDICLNVEILGRFDFLLAKALYAEKIRAIEPELYPADAQDRPALRLVNARHPLLKGNAVPLNLELGGEFSVLVVSGPNAGGKTVALKTVGLLVLMAQAGLPIPCAEGTCLPVYDDIFADIGDEQSIERTLSTFSAHISNIARIVKESTGKSLILLDELGISTDPAEGAALAQSVLRHLLNKGSGVVVTTHYSELKAFAHLTPGMRNASLDFDPLTLMPTYRLIVGMPGGSNALSIAERFGLPVDIINDARSIMSKGSQEVEAMLTDLTVERQRLEEKSRELSQESRRMAELVNQLESERDSLRQKEREMLQEIQDNMNREIAGLYRSIRQAENELKKQQTRERIERARTALERASVEADARSRVLRERLTEIKGDSRVRTELAVGDMVQLKDMDLKATVLSVNEGQGKVEVQAGDLKMTLNIDSVDRLETPGAGAVAERPVVRMRTTRPASYELDLRGQRAEFVESMLDSYLNDAVMSHLPEVRIIHGHGTGALKQAVRDCLGQHPLAKSFRPGNQGEGGDGVTMVKPG